MAMPGVTEGSVSGYPSANATGTGSNICERTVSNILEFCFCKSPISYRHAACFNTGNFSVRSPQKGSMDKIFCLNSR
jgi:hypothetical protein